MRSAIKKEAPGRPSESLRISYFRPGAVPFGEPLTEGSVSVTNSSFRAACQLEWYFPWVVLSWRPLLVFTRQNLLERVE